MYLSMSLCTYVYIYVHIYASMHLYTEASPHSIQMVRFCWSFYYHVGTAAAEIKAILMDVSSKLSQYVIIRYPALRESFSGIISAALEVLYDKTLAQLEELLQREKDPFTINDFLTQHINKIRYDRFESAVENAFRTVKAGTESWDSVKEEVAGNMKSWYRHTHGVNSASNAEDMSVILEAYWTLSAKRFIDNACMVIDRGILGALPGRINEELYKFVNDDSRLQAYFEEDGSLVSKREELVRTRDRLIKAASAMSIIPTMRREPYKVEVEIPMGPLGLGLSLAEEEGKVSVQHTTVFFFFPPCMSVYLVIYLFTSIRLIFIM